MINLHLNQFCHFSNLHFCREILRVMLEILQKFNFDIRFVNRMSNVNLPVDRM